MENLNENEVVTMEPKMDPVLETEKIVKEEKLITFNSVLKEAWDIFKYFFKEHVLATILLLVLLMIPIVNFLVIPIVIIIVGKKINGEENPFKGVTRLYFSKFWRMILLSLISIGLLLWKILPWVATPIIIFAIISILKVNSQIVGLIFSITAVAASIISAVILIKYSYGWIFSLQTFFFEDKKNKEALERSWELTLGNKEKIFFFLITLNLVITLTTFIALFIFAFVFRINLDNETQSSILRSIIYSPIYLITFTFLTVLYFIIKNNFGNFKLKISKWMKGIVITFLILIPLGILASVTLVALNSAREKTLNIELMNQIKQTEQVK